MEVDEIQTQAFKFSRVDNGRTDHSIKIGGQKGSENYPYDEEDGELIKRAAANGGGGGGADTNGLRSWHHSSRIIRVSRASGGKDRHSKVWTSKGLRDRRVRLSVTTALQFYDLQDRLGYDQPSKAVDWLIKAAADSIEELPSLNSSSFPDKPKRLSDEKRANGEAEQRFDSAEMELDDDPNNYQQNQTQNLNSLSKSACSSTSETSKNSGLSLSRSEIRVNRVKARERARQRTAKGEKEKEEESRIVYHQNVNPISQNSSFTELLTGGMDSVSNNNNSPTVSAHQNTRHWPVTQTDYFTTGLLGLSSSSRSNHSSGFQGQIQLGNSLQQAIPIPAFNMSSENHQELQQFSFVPNPEHHSSGLAGFTRGTLQSNIYPSFLPHHLQRFSSMDGSSPFYIGTPPMENHHHNQFPAGLDGCLQLYGDGSRSSDQKGKGKGKN